MSFVTSEFLVFFVVVTAAYWALPHRAQNVLLVVASLFFAGWVHPWFAGILLVTATVNHVAANLMVSRREWRRALLALTIAVAVANLGVFKYLDFGIQNVAAVLRAVGFDAHPTLLRLLLPAGLSFWTFQIIGYMVDVYRGRLAPRQSWIDFMVYVSFFPQLVAGPIERAKPFLLQIERPRRFSTAMVRSGLALALFGAVKKVVVADTLGPYVGAVYASEPSAVAAWAGCVAFMVQLLADFSGYADIAVGTGRILGFELTKNFNHPYLSRTPFELWDRWHISLSTWLRDYVYLPVSESAFLRRWLRIPGVPESGLVAQTRAAFVTWLFCGFWHGAAWHFVAWGMFWFVVQTAWLVARRSVPRPWLRYEKRWAMILVMLPLTAISHQLMREPEIADALGYLLMQPPLEGAPGWVEAQISLARATISLATVGALLLVLAMVIEERVLPRVGPTTLLFLESAWFGLAVVALAVFYRGQTQDFIYVDF